MTASGLADRARPLVKSIADTCKDLGVISGTAYAAYELFSRIVIALLGYLPPAPLDLICEVKLKWHERREI
jgi:hypothetical protein